MHNDQQCDHIERYVWNQMDPGDPTDKWAHSGQGNMPNDQQWDHMVMDCLEPNGPRGPNGQIGPQRAGNTSNGTSEVRYEERSKSVRPPGP